MTAFEALIAITTGITLALVELTRRHARSTDHHLKNGGSRCNFPNPDQPPADTAWPTDDAG